MSTATMLDDLSTASPGILVAVGLVGATAAAFLLFSRGRGSVNKVYDHAFEFSHSHLRQKLIDLTVLDRRAHTVHSDQLKPLLAEHAKRQRGSRSSENDVMGSPEGLFWKRVKSIEHMLLHLLEDVDQIQSPSLMDAYDFGDFIDGTQVNKKLDYEADQAADERTKMSKKAIQPVLERLTNEDRTKLELQLEMIQVKRYQVTRYILEKLNILDVEGLLVKDSAGAKQQAARQTWKGRAEHLDMINTAE